MTDLPTEASVMTQHAAAQHGFSLVELTVVLIIVALLSSGMILGLSAQHEATMTQEARRQLDATQEALLGFAIANGRLPCPAKADLANTDAAAGREDCTLQHGVIPWVILGTQETDPWGQRLTYFASSKFTALVAAGAQASFTMSTGIPPDNAGLSDIRNLANTTVAIDIAAVVVSHGARSNGAYLPDGSKIAGAANSELQNSNATQTFIADTPSATFDDQLVWISPNLLKSRLVAVGKLP